VATRALGGYHRASSTKLFTVNQKRTARFGRDIEGSGDFANSCLPCNCRVTYICIVQQ
jgi:hypothetical protein